MPGISIENDYGIVFDIKLLNLLVRLFHYLIFFVLALFVSKTELICDLFCGVRIF